MKEKKYQIFISSPKQSLKEERKAVINAILDMGHIPVGMENFVASDKSQWEIIEKELNITDYMIVISAGKYGSWVKNQRISWSEREFDYAVDNGIPILSFIYEDINKLPEDERESDEEKLAKLYEFRNKINNHSVRMTFSSPDNLAAHVSSSLSREIINTPRVGWIRGNQVQELESGVLKWIDI